VTDERNSDKEEIENVSDSTIKELIEKHKTTELPEPLEVSKLEFMSRLDFTSGGLPSEDKKNYCDSSGIGFYGRYNLIDRRNQNIDALVGVIDIFKLGQMSNWKSSDSNQTVWKIHLKSDLISVWDSIHVGLTKDQIVQFVNANDGFFMKKEDINYSCDFNNFTVVYNFMNDTLKELTVTRNCRNRKEKN